MEQQNVDADFSNKIKFSDEAHFHFDGFVDRQYSRIWGSDNSKAIVEKQMHKVSLFGTDFCLKASSDHFSSKLHLYGQTTTVNDTRYRDIFFVPKLQDMDVSGMWFQQHGASCHKVQETIQLLYE